ncbi:MAG: aldose 1-epimerase [Thermoplasmata archaeon]
MIKIGNENSYATVDLAGGGIQELVLENESLIKPSTDGYKTHGGMAILAPFANRIRSGMYCFMGREYVLPVNSEGNAIHGFAKDSNFSPAKVEDSYCRIRSDLTGPGYPWTIKLEVTYTVLKDEFKCSVVAKNSSNSPAPFQIGFHPYFTFDDYWSISSDLPGALLEYKDKFFPDGSSMVIDPFLIESVSAANLDNAFMHTGTLIFTTEKRKLFIDRKNFNYLVLYNGIYSKGISVAIEPMSAPPDAFNNEIGLAIIMPGSAYRASFGIRMTTT